MSGFCIILSSASGGLGDPWTPRLMGRSLHFPPILKKNPSIQNLNETTVCVVKYYLYMLIIPWIINDGFTG
jgi:hypothetical protein